jgi:transposase
MTTKPVSVKLAVAEVTKERWRHRAALLRLNTFIQSGLTESQLEEVEAYLDETTKIINAELEYTKSFVRGEQQAIRREEDEFIEFVESLGCTVTRLN